MKPQQDQNEVWVALQENHFWTSPFVRAGNTQCFHVRFPLPASITRKVHIYMSSSCLCMFMPRSTHSERCPTILVAEENRWWLDHAASIVRFWKAIINKRSQYVDGTSLGVHICQTIAGYQHETPSGTQIAGADSKSRPSTASGATIWLRSGSQYRWLEGLAYRLTQHASTSPIPYPWSTHQFASICYDLTGFFLGWVAWNHPNWGVHVTGIHSSNWWPCGQPHHRRYWYVLVLDVDIQQ